MTSPEEILSAFERAAGLFLEFRMGLQQQQAPTLHFAIEAETRLEQALYLLRRFRELELAYDEKDRALSTASPEQYVSGVHALGDELKLFGEAFYYFAWRARQVLKRLDGFEFDADGVRDVRNHLTATLLARLAERGDALRPHLIRLQALLDDYGPQELATAVEIALACDAHGGRLNFYSRRHSASMKSSPGDIGAYPRPWAIAAR